LKSRLNEIGLVSEEVNINQPIIPQLSDVDVLVNGFIKINKLIIDASPKDRMVILGNGNEYTGNTNHAYLKYR
jgi:hypothetical protein